MYSCSKSALHSLTEGLFMECKPFNINVMLLAPGSVKSNIAASGTEAFRLPENSLYRGYLDQIVRRINSSQGPNSMPTADFARVVVKNALAKNPPRYLTLGGNSTMFSIFQWLPRTWVLNLLWKRFSNK